MNILQDLGIYIIDREKHPIFGYYQFDVKLGEPSKKKWNKDQVEGLGRILIDIARRTNEVA